MRVAVIDDDIGDQARLLALLSQWAQASGTPLAPAPAVFSSGEAFLEQFAPDRYDVVFLDIFMEGLDGMETARRLRQRDRVCRLVFTTTSTDFAVDSYEVDASYYLVKPFLLEKLAQAMERCGARLLEQGQSLVLPDGDRLYLHPIVYTEFQDRRVLVHNQDGSHREIAMSQGDFAEALLAFPYFCDCMKGMLVNLEAVDKLLEDRFLLKDGGTVPISRLKYRQVRERFLAYTYARVRGDT